MTPPLEFSGIFKEKLTTALRVSVPLTSGNVNNCLQVPASAHSIADPFRLSRCIHVTKVIFFIILLRYNVLNTAINLSLYGEITCDFLCFNVIQL